MAKKKPKKSWGGKRDGCGRKSDGVERPATLYIRTTQATADWFESRAIECGGRGRAIEAMHEMWKELPDG
jgi:hypothetical protein